MSLVFLINDHVFLKYNFNLFVYVIWWVWLHIQGGIVSVCIERAICMSGAQLSLFLSFVLKSVKSWKSKSHIKH
jgi:hypothetical protein